MKHIPQKVDIPGYEGKYYATIEGDVYRYGKCKPLKSGIKRKYRVMLYDLQGNRKMVSISKIMRECYFGGKEGVFLHKNGATGDYSYWNIILTTKAESLRRRRTDGGKRVVKIRENDGEVTFYKSITECAKRNFISNSAVSRKVNGVVSQENEDTVFMFEEDYYLKYERDYEGEPDNN